jgi:class 3 adenylate cyclase/tetratricopeptide (TPR) repeat protein
MLCTNCGSDNTPDAAFCEECGRRIEVICPACQAPVSPTARFCKKCGAGLNGAAIASEPIATKLSEKAGISVAVSKTVEVTDGERKTVTALFADITGSMELMEDLDPEEARAVVDPALKLMIDAVRRYDGYIVQSTGDGIFALFGAPVAHEDHPQRALYAALKMQDEMRRYSAKLRQAGQRPVEARVGVNTGEVVVRSIATSDGDAEYTPIGHSTSLAARMQALAPTGSIAATSVTRKLCEGYFTFKSLGPTVVKGVTEPIEVFEVTGLGLLRTRLERAASRGLTKFVGRQREMDALKHAAEQAQAGHGQIVAVMADPGVGKSRLFYEFKATSQSGWMVLEALSVSYGKATAYLPVLELLSQYFEISRGDDERKRRERMLGKVLGLDRMLEDTLPYLYSLQGIADSGDSLAQMDPQIRRRRTLEVIKRILLRESINQPLMVIFEDLHWIDSETQALLNLLVDAIANARILLLVNYRPEYRHEWGSRTHYTQLRLDPLGRESAEEMLSAMLSDDMDLGPLKRQIIERTQGTPFFMEEMVQALFEEGVVQRNGIVKLAKPISAIKVPSTVQAVLASRIDRLAAPEKELLQTVAVLGREFSLSLAQRVTLKAGDDLEQMLSQLQFGEYIYEQPAVGEVEYRFKHALTQEVAYNSLLVERRRRIHQKTANAIEVIFSERLEDHYTELAYHFLRSTGTAKAIHYAQLAADQAVNRAAYSVAVNLIEASLRLLEALPEGTERLRAELSLCSIENRLSFALYGGASPEREQAVRRMCELGSRLEEKELQLPGLTALCNLHFVRGECREGLELANRCLKLAEDTHDAKWLAVARFNTAASAMSSGNLSEAIAHSQEMVRQAKRAQVKISPVGLLYETTLPLAQFLQLQGRISDALRAAELALRCARESRHLFSLGFVLTIVEGWFRHLRREPDVALARAEEAIALSEENGFVNWLHWGRFHRGRALAETGKFEQGIAEMEEATESFRRTGGNVSLPYTQALLAQAYARIGEFEKALTMLDESLTRIRRTGEKRDQAEILRFKGEALLMRDTGAIAQAEKCFRAALEVARAQEAKWWQLRASVSLARLLRDIHRRDEARTLLTEIYNWFTEGFNLPDLREAKALLDELSC